jgi:hypothetical protein
MKAEAHNNFAACFEIERRSATMKFNSNVSTVGCCDKKKSNHMLLKIIGGAMLAVVGAVVIASLPDIKRYIRISTM